MLLKLGLAIVYFVTVVYILLIVWPALYCWQHGCRGPDGDAFMPAFFLTPLGTITTAISLYSAIHQIRKRQAWSWIFWPLAIIFAVVLLGALAFIAFGIYQLAVHHRAGS